MLQSIVIIDIDTDRDKVLPVLNISIIMCHLDWSLKLVSMSQLNSTQVYFKTVTERLKIDTIKRTQCKKYNK